mmetsp:Transcript_3927/g.9700  ORF Transcript_3927/g.9700 Transcript_3927/m.9700 type:complete len:151 (+) Transcript_3927:229-681(+)
MRTNIVPKSRIIEWCGHWDIPFYGNDSLIVITVRRCKPFRPEKEIGSATLSLRKLKRFNTNEVAVPLVKPGRKPKRRKGRVVHVQAGLSYLGLRRPLGEARVVDAFGDTDAEYVALVSALGAARGALDSLASALLSEFALRHAGDCISVA